jgi:hypothetical protein
MLGAADQEEKKVNAAEGNDTALNVLLPERKRSLSLKQSAKKRRKEEVEDAVNCR